MKLRADLRLVPVLTYLSGFSIWFAKGISLPGLELRPTDLIGALLILVTIMRQNRMRAPHSDAASHPGYLKPYAFTAFFALAIVFIIISGFVSVIGAEDVGAVFSFILRYTFGLLFFLSLVGVQQLARIRAALISGLLAGGVTSVLAGSLGYFIPQIGGLVIRYGDRLQGFTNHPNQFAMLLTATLPIVLALIASKKSSWRPWGVLALFGAGLAMTGSKANLALGGIMIFVTLAAFSRLRESVIKRLKALGTAGLATLLLVFAGFFVLTVSSPRTITTIQRLLDEPARVTAVVSRSEMWNTALQIGRDNPWTGIGGNNTYLYLPHSHAHNVFFEFFMTLGYPGLWALSMLIFVLSVLLAHAWLKSVNGATAMSLRHRMLLIGAPLGACTYALANLSSDSFGGSTLPIFWILLAIAVAHLKSGSAAKQQRVMGTNTLISDVR